MSVRVNDRGPNDLLVITKAKQNAVYTIRITSNEKNFPKRYRMSIVNNIQSKAYSIVENLIEANEMFPHTKREYEYRRFLQRKAMAECRSLLLLIDISHEAFGIQSKTLEYWTRNIFDIRNLTAAWLKKDESRYKDLQ